MKDDLRELVRYFCARSGSTAVLLISDSLEEVKRFDNPKFKTFVSSGSLTSEDMPAHVEFIDLASVGKEFMADKVLLCSGFLEGKRPFSNAARRLRRLSDQSVFSIISIKRSALWNPLVFNAFFSKTHSSLKEVTGEHLVAIGGVASNIHNLRFQQIKALAIVPVFNELDIIEPVISHLLSQGLDIHVVDNWSTDGSYEAVLELAKENQSRIKVERFPESPKDKFEWGLILERVSEIAQTSRNKKYEWVMINDADEIRWSPWENKTLQEAFSFINALGYSSVDFTLFNFIPTAHGYRQGNDPVKFFEYGEFPTPGWAFLQIKAWKNIGPVDLASSGGHHAKFKNQMTYPLKFLLAHYPLRSQEQASRKIFKERKPRFTTEERAKGWSTHYDDVKRGALFIKNEDNLIKFDKNFHSKYLVQRVSGIGIKLKKT